MLTRSAGASLRTYLLTIAGGNVVWEIAHLPLYTIWTSGSLGEKLFAVVHCTAGDVLIALSALAAALVVMGRRDWPARQFRPVSFMTVTLGVVYTVFSEWLNVSVRGSWEYSELMPTLSVPGFRLGLSPLLQWIVIPSLAFWRLWRMRKR